MTKLTGVFRNLAKAPKNVLYPDVIYIEDPATGICQKQQPDYQSYVPDTTGSVFQLATTTWLTGWLPPDTILPSVNNPFPQQRHPLARPCSLRQTLFM